LLRRIAAFFRPTFRYWAQTEVHVYAFSVAANVVLSFFPFLIVMVSICKNVFHSRPAVDAMLLGLRDYFPDELINFIQRKLLQPRRFEWVSILLLLFTSNGVFQPLEVALNRVWGIAANRSFLRNQAISYGMIFACGTLALISTSATALNQQLFKDWFGANAPFAAFLGVAAFKIVAVPAIMLALFLTYWLIPNGKVDLRRTIAAAIGTGILLELLKWAEVLAWPFLNAKLDREYGPFIYSVTIILWSFCASMLVLAGAEWASRPYRILPTETQPFTLETEDNSSYERRSHAP
jgi:YihY family inner membrane protein